MTKNIVALHAGSGSQLMLWYAGGEARILDTVTLAGRDSEFAGLFGDGAVPDPILLEGGRQVAWGDDVVIDAGRLYGMTEPFDVVTVETARLVAQTVQLRKEQGFSQARVANAVGIKQPIVARLETGVNAPRIDTLLKVLGPLGKTLEVVDLDCVG